MRDLQSITEFDELLATQKYLLIDYSAEWCGPCNRLKPLLDSLQGFYPNVTFIRIDVDTHQELAELHQIRSIPTVMFYVDGTLQQEIVQGANIEKIKLICEKYFV